MVRSVICLPISAAIWLIADGGGTTATGNFIIVAAGFGNAFSMFTWIWSSSLVPLMLIECVSMIGALVIPLLLAPYLYNGDSVSLIQWIGCILIFASIFFFINKDGGKKKQGSVFKKVMVIGLYMISAMINTIFKKYYTFHITEKNLGSIEYFTFISFLSALGLFLVLFAVFYKNERKANGGSVELPFKKVRIYILIAAINLYVSELFATYASQLPSAIYYPLTRAILIVGTFLLEVMVFKDKVTLKKVIGFIVVIAGIILVNL